MPTNELSVRDKWGGLFHKRTGERLPESIEDVDRIVAKCHGLKKLPIVSHSIFPVVDIKDIDSLFLKKLGKKGRKIKRPTAIADEDINDFLK